MPRRNRLTRADFIAIHAARPRRLHGSLFALSVTPTPGKGLKYACVVSKKVSNKANIRNLVKRRARAAMMKEFRGSTLLSMLVFTAKAAARDAAYEDIAADIHKLAISISAR